MSTVIAACESASRLACEHPFIGALVPIVLIIAMVAFSALAAVASSRKDRL